MGATLTYARQYALFALVGIAGEDDLDAPDIMNDPPPAELAKRPEAHRKTGKGRVHRPPLLDQAVSEELRDQLLTEISALADGENLALWAQRLPAKNTLTEGDARLVEAAYHALLEDSLQGDLDRSAPAAQAVRVNAACPDVSLFHDEQTGAPAPVSDRPHDQTVTPMAKPVRRRNKAHLAYIAEQPCLI